jgi:hypothetical protein
MEIIACAPLWEYNWEIIADDSCDIEALLLRNYCRWTTINTEGWCQKIIIKELPFVDICIWKSLNYWKNIVARTVHDISENYCSCYIGKLL